jgi:hypothetical protein
MDAPQERTAKTGSLPEHGHHRVAEGLQDLREGGEHLLRKRQTEIGNFSGAGTGLSG